MLAAPLGDGPSTDLRGWAFHRRRDVLLELGAGWSPPLTLSPATTDVAVATDWFRDMTGAGIDGLVVKGADQTYRTTGRTWLKVKHREQLEVVCAAVIGPMKLPCRC
ncbi:hypothetical protein [Pengzhenrongella sp.]|uniref:ATP-dependent DNA ligase n=1 Tax=Pengzhenrongella sp. TaxID=2888820 RepID=UPI002F947E4C